MTTTIFTLDGFRITKTLGVVRGITVRSRSILGTIGASLQTLVGGNITLSPNCFLNLFYGSGHKVALKGVEDAQIQIPEPRADKVWRVHDGVREGCIALEAIAVPDRRDFRSINLKNAALQVSLNVPVITVLVYLERGKCATFPDGYEDELGGPTNVHRFVRILLWEHEERIRSGELRELSPYLKLKFPMIRETTVFTAFFDLATVEDLNMWLTQTAVSSPLH